MGLRKTLMVILSHYGKLVNIRIRIMHLCKRVKVEKYLIKRMQYLIISQ